MPLFLASDHPSMPSVIRLMASGGRLCLSRLLPILLLASLMGLSPLAHASPPDPAWVPGFYDGADDDDVVLFLTNMGAVTGDPAEGIGRVGLAVGLLLLPSVSLPSHAPLLAFHLRSPPAS